MRQALDDWRERSPEPVAFASRGLYALIRHPISTGWMLLPWLTPELTLGHALLGVGLIVYVLCATPHEEADLVAELGSDYQRYQRQVPKFIPG